MKNRKLVSLFEIFILLVGLFSFSYLVALTEIKVVSADPIHPSGCCLKTVGGSTCQEMNVNDAGQCADSLVGTGCAQVEDCQKGCCFNANSGVCSLNAPKQSCEQGGGNWSNSATCNIQECQIGCCVLGTSVSMTTSRECTLQSRQYGFDKDFKNLDSKGTCSAYVNLQQQGACLYNNNDGSGEKKCSFTTKGKCTGDFNPGYLCTAKELNTECFKTDKTTCKDGKVYYLDSCKNIANVYNFAKYADQNYWDLIISPDDSCSGGENCGNCNYADGSICSPFSAGMVKPAQGNNVCKSLNCANGKKHGESWCISDADNSKMMSNAVGTRSYVASCFEGEIKLEGCSPFNQEICIQNDDANSNRTDGMCITNDWRSCIYANDAENYNEIKTKCDSLPQCIMFNDISGNEQYKDLPGFKEIANADQGRAGELGKDMNKVITHCVPRSAPGYQFWDSSVSSNPFGTKQVESSTGYGGSKSETNSICDLGTFTCISHIETTSSMVSSSTVDVENPECNMQAVDQSKQKVSLMMDALDARCRSLGSCGLQYNIQGKLGSEGFEVNRVYIDKKGKSYQGYSTEGYNVSDDFLSNLKTTQQSNVMGAIKTLANLTSIQNGASRVTDFVSISASSSSMVASAFSGNSLSQSGAPGMFSGASGMVGAVGALAGLGMAATAATPAVAATATTPAVAAVPAGAAYGAFTTFAFAAAAFMLGSIIGGMMARGQPPGQAAVTTAMWAGGVTAALTATAGIGALMVTGTAGTAAVAATATTVAVAAVPSTLGTFGSIVTFLCAIPILCIAVAIAAIVYMLTVEGVDHEYYVTEFKCTAWEPPVSGDCSACNSDVRPCSEDKCRSIGNNCHYFVEKGEPGYCATINDVWQAKITPWAEIITPGLKYSNVSFSGFKILSNIKEELPAWQSVTFGVKTDKQSTCKMDTVHSKEFDAMSYEMVSAVNPDTNRMDGLTHQVTLSPFVNGGQADTPPLKEGDNEFYIRCQNFAGLVNDAEFTVQMKVAAGPDLTPPIIVSFAPSSNSFIKKESSNASLVVSLDEPAECRYSVDYDKDYSEMENKMFCLTNPSLVFRGTWSCLTVLTNFTQVNNYFFRCKDQPSLVNETDFEHRNANPIGEPYILNICQDTLRAQVISPTSAIDSLTQLPVKLVVQTTGCINGGDSYCSYNYENNSNYISFLTTGEKIHEQVFTGLVNGENNLMIKCEDTAGNVAETNATININLDETAPEITRAYAEGGKLFLTTNEPSFCSFRTDNMTNACDFEIDNATSFSFTNSGIYSTGKNYYIKCQDSKGNKPNGCTSIFGVSAN